MKWLTWDTLTNAAYLLVAILVAHNDGPTGYVFIATMAFLTVGSAMYHAGVPQANHLDVMGMYMVGLAVWVYTLLGPGLWTPATMMVLAVPGAHWLRFHQLDVRMEVKIAALFGVLYATAFMFHGADIVLLVSLLAMAAGLSLRFVWDNERWSHGAWHVLSAIGLGLLWLGVTP